MYNDHYQLSGRPFQLTPDPRFWFDITTHKKAMAYLGYGLSQGEGFIVITGQPGTGKTTLLGHLLSTIDHERLNVIHLVSSQLEAEELLRFVAAGLGVDMGSHSKSVSKAMILAGIERGLHAMARSGKRTLLIVDEVQALPFESLEELRMLSNFQAGGYALLQIFLVGQPEFREKLYDKRLEQLRMRVIATHHLELMTEDEVEAYLIHRLSVVGWRGKPRFTHNAVAAIHRWSGGNARLINILAGRVMMYGEMEQIDSFTGEDVAEVIADLDEETPDELTEGPTPPALASPVMPASAPVPPSRQPQPQSQSQPLHPLEQNLPSLAEDAIAARVAALEARLNEQDAALRRVLTLLVDWVEGEGRQPGPPRSGMMP